MNLKPTGSRSIQKDITKPDGEACNADGTLKDASEIEWLHSPGSKSPPVSLSKRARNDTSSDADGIAFKKTRVSIKSRAEK